MTEPIKLEVLQSLCASDGEMCSLMRDSFGDAESYGHATRTRTHHWSQTPLGPVEQWPQSLLTTVSILLSTPHPMLLFWGCDLVQFYNDAYASILGTQKHSPAIGQRGCDCWAEIWQVIEPQIHHVFTAAQEICHENQLVCFNRHGYIEEIYFTYSYSPVRDETKGVGGVLVVCTETTQRVLSDRRLQTLQELNANVMQAQTVKKACEIAIDSLSINPYDMPFVLLYLVESNNEQAKLISTTGIEKGTDASPIQVNLTQNHVWGLAEVCQTGQAMLVDDLETQFHDLPGGVWHTPPSSALVMPIRQLGQQHTIAALLVMGISPCRVFDDQYRGFFDLVVNSVATAIANAHAYAPERQQADNYLTKPFSNHDLLPHYQANLINDCIAKEAPCLVANTAQQEAKLTFEQLTQILESMTDAFVALDQDWRIIYQNAAAERINNGKPRSQVLGKTHWEEWPASVGSALEHNYRNAMNQQVAVHFEHHYYFPPDYDVWLEIYAYPTKESLGIFFRDITKQKQAQAALVASQIELQQKLAEIEAIYQSAPIGLNVLDTNLRFVRINQRLAQINGLPVEAHIGRTVREVLPNLADAAEQVLRPILETGKPLLNVEITGETPAQPGVKRTWLEHFLPLKNGDEIIGISTVCEEITERKHIEAQRQQAQEELRQSKEELEIRVAERTAELSQINADLQRSESTLRSFFNSGAMLMGIVELHNNDILHISDNRASAEFFGTTPEAIQNQFASDLGVPQQTIDEWVSYYRQAQQVQAAVRFEYPHDTPNGQRWLCASVCPIAISSTGYPRFSYIVEDISERKQAQKHIEASLREKEVLLKEIHHRVKNNLGIVSSLLQMQSRRTQDPQANAILRDSHNRIASIALVHEKLYCSENLANIDFAHYIPNLTAHLFASYNTSSNLVKLSINTDKVNLDIDTAVPCGLIINELLSNALKYAFLDNRSGQIHVKFYQDSEQNLILIVQDNGIGLPENFDTKKSKTLGINLVQGLVKQLQGTIDINCQQGTKFTISFSKSRTCNS